MRPPRGLLAALALLVLARPCPAGAALQGPGAEQRIPAARAPGPVAVDGRLDDEAWRAATVFDAFVQRYPTAGAPPGQRTELRVLFDDRTLYVGVRCHDSQPALVGRRLGRRDSDPWSDMIQVFVDSSHDHRSGHYFQLNAAGVQGDGIIYDDRVLNKDWDGVWEGEARVGGDGWVAELALPLRLFRFSAAHPLWGFGVRRTVARTHEEIDTVANPKSSGVVFSRLGHLDGLGALQPRRELEAVPFVAARALLRPQYSDPSRPQPRFTDVSGDLGLDLHAPLGGRFDLNATLNPDFGQVEADQILQNLSTVETYFPEKRPFFMQGLELFQPVGGQTNQILFYSRRIGLETPLLAAAKLTGSVPGVADVGLLDAFVVGPAAPRRDEERPDRRVLFHARRPLHLGTETELPADETAPTNFLAAVVRHTRPGGSRVGAVLAAATPLAGGCSEAEARQDPAPPGCAQGGTAAALDFDLKSADSVWGAMGQLSLSQAVRGPPVVVLADGTRRARGDVGSGLMLQAGKLGGAGLRADLVYEYASPRFDLGPTGYLLRSNVHAPMLTVRYVRPDGWGPLRAFESNWMVGGGFSSDGRWTRRKSWTELFVGATLPSFDQLLFDTWTESRGYDVREIAQEGVPFERPSYAGVAAALVSKPDRAFSATLQGIANRRARVGDLPASVCFQLLAQLVWRPHPALETSLTVIDDRMAHGPRYVEALGDGLFLFADLTSAYLSATLRQAWVVTPRLTLQAYAQLFTEYGRYGRFLEGRAGADGRLPLASLGPSARSEPGFQDSLLNVNLVARWEYRPGSALYVVYMRSQESLPFGEGAPVPATLRPEGLGSGPTRDGILVKWSVFL